MVILVKNFQKGLITRIEKESVVRGSASDMLNWHVLGDHIELRRGQKLLGTEVSAGSGNNRVNFVGVGRKYNQTQVLFWGQGNKVYYYNPVTELNVEIGINLIETDEDISFTPYQSIAGSFVYISSPNNKTFKIAVANPGSASDQQQNTFRGFMKATQGRVFLYNRKDKFGGSDKTGLQLSTIDRDSLADYSFTSAESVGTGNGTSVTFTGTLAFKASNDKMTCHFVRIAGATSALSSISAITQATSGVITSVGHGLAVGDVVVIQDVVGMTQINKRITTVTAVSGNDVTVDIDTSGFTAYSSGGSIGKAELFTDDRSGGLTGNQGGTGTINYVTGAFSVTFQTAPVNLASVVSDYYKEDSTDQGVLDFSQGTGSSIADSLIFRQDDAGQLQYIGSIGSTHFCIHSVKTYALRLISSNDITNLIYREKVGIPFFRGACATGEGIYYIDVSDSKNPTIRLLEINVAGTEILPKPISNSLDLSGYNFDRGVIKEFFDYICVFCRSNNAPVNNRMFAYNKTWKTWELHEIFCDDADVYNGALIIGDSLSPNIFKMFSGLADQNSLIRNYYITGNDELDYSGAKDLRIMKVSGLIGIDQQLDISYSVDNEPFIFAKSILGRGSYVDLTQRKLIGNQTLGESMIGGGSSDDNTIYASPYELEFFVGTKKFQRIRLKFEAKSTGYVSVSEYDFIDLREKGQRTVTKYVGS